MLSKVYKLIYSKLNQLYEYIKANIYYAAGVTVFFILVSRAYSSIAADILLVAFLFAFSLAKYYEKYIKLKYLFGIASFLSLLSALFNIKMEVGYLFGFCLVIPVLYAYLLKEFFIANIMSVGIAISFYFTRDIKIIDFIFTIIGVNLVIISQTLIARNLGKINEEGIIQKLDSRYDSLTGLLTLEQILKEGQSMLDRGSGVTVVIIDIDDFKDINNTYGYFKGNNVLIQMAKLLKREINYINAMIGRAGGDGFVIIAENLSEREEKQFIKKLNQRLDNESFFIDSAFENIKVNSSIGVANKFSDNLNSIEKLLNSADLNMYYNKIQNKNRVNDMEKDNSHMFNVLIPEEYKKILKILAEKDMYTYVHSKYTAKYAYELGKKLGLPENMLRGIYIAGWIHDIGKLLISNEILRKPDRLTQSEYETIKQHVKSGYDILTNIISIESPEVIINAMKCHHEQWNGKGYPNALTGEATPIEGRILQIADAFSAMTIKRVFREPVSIDNAITEISAKSGTQFDPSLAGVFIEYIKEKTNSLRPVGV